MCGDHRALVDVFLTCLPPCFLGTGSLTEPESHQFGSDGWLVSPRFLAFLVVGLQMCTTVPGFVCGKNLIIRTQLALY